MFFAEMARGTTKGMYTIRKFFDFSASHQLDHLPAGHQCKRLHGHNYQVELVLRSSTLDQRGFVVDYGDLADFGEFLKQTFDHRHLNQVVDFPTTAENLARFLYDWAEARWSQVAAVRVSETPKTWAEYSKEVY